MLSSPHVALQRMFSTLCLCARVCSCVSCVLCCWQHNLWAVHFMLLFLTDRQLLSSDLMLHTRNVHLNLCCCMNANRNQSQWPVSASLIVNLLMSRAAVMHYAPCHTLLSKKRTLLHNIMHYKAVCALFCIIVCTPFMQQIVHHIVIGHLMHCKSAHIFFFYTKCTALQVAFSHHCAPCCIHHYAAACAPHCVPYIKKKCLPLSGGHGT